MSAVKGTDAVRVGFVGLGAMGVGMAKNVLAAGFPLSVLGHSRREPVERLVGLGATEVASARELAQASDIVVLCVTTSEVVEALITGPDGLLSGERGASAGPLLVIDCGTSNPVSTQAMGEALTAAGGSLMDVPLGRSAQAAEEGTLNMMAGGSDEDFARAKPVLDSMSENLFHLGPLGTGHTIKLLNNAYSMSVAVLCSQIVATARAGGVDVSQLVDVMAAGPNRSGFFDWMMVAATEGDTTRLDFALKHGLKDVGYFNALADSLDVPVSLPQAAAGALQAVVDAGRGDESVPSLMLAPGRTPDRA